MIRRGLQLRRRTAKYGGAPSIGSIAQIGVWAGALGNLRNDQMPCRGVRGATTIERNEREEVLLATRQLLALMVRQNGIDPRDVASALFSTTTDIDAEFPALAARQLGWLDVPLLCGHEMLVPGS